MASAKGSSLKAVCFLKENQSNSFQSFPHFVTDLVVAKWPTNPDCLRFGEVALPGHGQGSWNHVLATVRTIIAFGLDLQEAVIANDFCREKGKNFLWLVQNGSLVTFFCDSPGLPTNPEGFCRFDDKAIFIGDVMQNSSETLITSQVPHCLSSGNVIEFSAHAPVPRNLLGKLYAVEIVSENRFYVVPVNAGFDSRPHQSRNNSSHIRLIGSDSTNPSFTFVPLKESIYIPKLVHVDGSCPAVRHVAAVMRASNPDELHSQTYLENFAIKFQFSCCDPKKFNLSSAFEAVRSEPSIQLRNLLLSLAKQQLSNLESKRFQPPCQWIHLDLSPPCKDPILSSSASLADRAICICGLSPLGISIFSRLLELCPSLGVKEIILIPGGPDKVVTAEHLRDDVTGILREKDLWTSTGQRLKDLAESQHSGLRVSIVDHELSGENEIAVFNADFFEKVGLAIVASGSFEQRRYIGTLSVAHKITLLDIAVDYRSGHVQTFIPCVTESRVCTQDLSDEVSIPFCVLKSFPHNSDHCANWAAYKKRRLLEEKPEKFNEFFKDNSLQEVNEFLKNEHLPDGIVNAYKLLRDSCTSWFECVKFARQKFEKYFLHKAQSLLHHFPPETETKSGKFWSHPKKIPNCNVIFSQNNPLHLEFVRTLALCWAHLWKIQITDEDTTDSNLIALLDQVVPDPVAIRAKQVVTDETVTREEVEQTSSSHSSIDFKRFATWLKDNKFQDLDLAIPTRLTDKLLTCLTLLRCEMYNIPVDKSTVLNAAKNIPQCLSEISHVVTELACIEMDRISKGVLPCDWWVSFNGQPQIVRSEPIRCPIKKIGNFSYTLWDQLDVKGQPDWTLQDFIVHLETTIGFEIGMVVHGSRMIFVHFMPNHKSRLPQLMSTLVKRDSGVSYVVLTVTPKDDQSDETIPPIRYFFNV